MSNPSSFTFRKLAVYLVNKLWLLLASLIILTAVVFTLLRFLLPQVNHFKQDIVDWLETDYGVQVEVDRIDGEWGPNGPILSLTNLRLESPDQRLTQINVGELKIHIDTFTSLLTKRITTEQIVVSKAKLGMIIDRKLGVRIERPDSDETDSAELSQVSELIIDTLFGQKNLTVTESRITLENLDGRQSNYFIKLIDIVNFSDIHQISGLLENEYNGQAKLVAEIFGDPADAGSYTNLYIEGSDLDLSTLPGMAEFEQLKPLSGNFNWQIWGDWRNGRWQTAAGKLALANVEWQSQLPNDPQGNPHIEALNLDFRWEYDESNRGALSFYNGSLKKRDSNATPIQPVYALFEQLDGADIRWEVLTNNFQISPFTRYLALPMADGSMPEKLLENTRLQLLMGELGLRLERVAGQWQSPTLIANFKDLVYDRYADLPNLSGVSGEITMVEGVGHAQVAGNNAVLEMQRLFRTPIEYEKLEVSVNWQLDDNNKADVVIDSAHFKTPHLSLNAQTRFFFQDDQLNMALYAEVADIDTRFKSLYLPTGIMSPGLVEYLDRSVESGTISLAKAAVRGPMARFPFNNPDGLFSILGTLEQAEFSYLPGWPTAHEMDARLLFEANGMDLQALSGHSAGITINNARAVIEDFKAPGTPFSLSIDANSFDNKGTAFLLQTPIAHIGENLSELDYSGQMRVNLAMDLLLKEAGKLRLSGKVTPDIKRSRLVVKGFDLSNIDGELFFDEKGVLPSSLKAVYAENPVAANIVSGRLPGEPKLLLDIDGKVSAKAIADYLGEKWRPFVSGETQMRALLAIGPENDPESVEIELDSDLQGLALAFPDQLAKDKAAITPLKLTGHFTDIARMDVYWQNFKARWWYRPKEESFEHIGGRFLFDSDEILPEYPLKGYQVEADLETASLAEWANAITSIIEAEKAQEGGEPMDLEFKVNLDILENPVIDLHNLTLSLEKKEAGNWFINADSSDGQLSFELDTQGPIKILGQDLKLKLKPEFIQQNEDLVQDITELERRNKQTIDNPDFRPESIPEFELECLQCFIDDIKLGDVRASNLVRDGHMIVSGNMLDGKRHDLNFRFEWFIQESQANNAGIDLKGEPPETGSAPENNPTGQFSKSISKLDVTLRTDNLGKLMSSLKIPGGVRDAGAFASASVWWNDQPQNFDLYDLNGVASFRLGQGYLRNVSDAKARLFSVLSLQSLSRRLQLDFKDVYKKGFHFDKLTGAVRMQNSQVELHDIFVDGSAAKVSLNGGVDLVNQNTEQHALVVPQLTASLPVLTAWAVEPTTGVLVFLLSKIFEPVIEVVTQIEYRIHGPIDDIQVDEVKKQKTKVKYPEQDTQSTQQIGDATKGAGEQEQADR